MNIFQAIILGIVEGATEFLPISSTAHLIITAHILGVEQTEFVKLFEVCIQAAAVLAVVPLFVRTCIKTPKLIVTVIAAFIPTALAGVLLHSFIKDLFDFSLVIALALIAGGIGLIAVEYQREKKGIQERHPPVPVPGTPGVMTNGRTHITLWDGIMMGAWQMLAVVPGVSRSGATFIGGMLAGIDRTALVTFSFLLSVPTIIGASVFDFASADFQLTTQEIFMLLVGFAAAWGSAVLSVRTLLSYISRHRFTAFGWYRIALGGIILCLVGIGLLA